MFYTGYDLLPSENTPATVDDVTQAFSHVGPVQYRLLGSAAGDGAVFHAWTIGSKEMGFANYARFKDDLPSKHELADLCDVARTRCRVDRDQAATIL